MTHALKTKMELLWLDRSGHHEFHFRESPTVLPCPGWYALQRVLEFPFFKRLALGMEDEKRSVVPLPLALPGSNLLALPFVNNKDCTTQ